MLVAANTDRSGGPFRLDGTVAPAPEAGPGRAGPATPADRAARGDPLAGPGLPAYRADRRRALVAAIAQVRSGGCRPLSDLAGPAAAPAWPLRGLVARGADRPGIAGPGDGALPAAGRAYAGRARGAELAAGAAAGHPGSGAPHPAAPAAFRHDLLVLVIASRADTALGTPGVDPPGLTAASTRSLAVARRAGAADPARGGLAPQVSRDPAAPRAGRGRDRQIPGIDQRVRQPDQHQRICGRRGSRSRSEDVGAFADALPAISPHRHSRSVSEHVNRILACRERHLARHGRRRLGKTLHHCVAQSAKPSPFRGGLTSRLMQSGSR